MCIQQGLKTTKGHTALEFAPRVRLGGMWRQIYTDKLLVFPHDPNHIIVSLFLMLFYSFHPPNMIFLFLYFIFSKTPGLEVSKFLETQSRKLINT